MTVTVLSDGRRTLSTGHAARQLELRTGEFELAVQLEEVRTVPAAPDRRPGRAGPPARRRVPAEEVARLQAERGFPEALRERVRTVTTNEAAAMLGIGPGRALRLTRAGCVAPVRFYVNRFGAVVWLYLASEITAFADREPELLRGDTPPAMRVMLSGGQDWRGRQWRSRRIAQLMGQADDPWETAAVIAAVLPPEERASVAEDVRERALLRRLRPTLATALTATPAARESFERVLTAEEFDEVLWYRVNLSRALETARREAPDRLRPAPAPPVGRRAGHVPEARNSPAWQRDRPGGVPARA
ncbi:DUF6397 family protein [Streptomyces sp. RS10V-4]|uniref:DUF6397 family protein n=1 Tax=Streptomyces rhizoryzae TaxID=2932493 RepID=UPI002002B04D|nr:DUF6397 family protein [Streptomyces rhizoryzae]MCK7625709.1 DUF6397 family protein [Streptomyces rhizoryzae]